VLPSFTLLILETKRKPDCFVLLLKRYYCIFFKELKNNIKVFYLFFFAFVVISLKRYAQLYTVKYNESVCHDITAVRHACSSEKYHLIRAAMTNNRNVLRNRNFSMEFGNVGFYGVKQIRSTRRKPSKQRREPTINST
jgi:hypothetical protein